MGTYHQNVHEIGWLRLENGVIRYESTVYIPWEIPLDSVRVIGEHTTEDGPALEDWFVDFVTDEDHCYEAPVNATRVVGPPGTQAREKIDRAMRMKWRDQFANEEAFEAIHSEARVSGFLDELSAAVGSSIDLDLFDSAEFRSRIIWPKQWQGRPLFAWSRGRRWWNRFVAFRAYRSLDPEVLKLLRGECLASV